MIIFLNFETPAPNKTKHVVKTSLNSCFCILGRVWSRQGGAREKGRIEKGGLRRAKEGRGGPAKPDHDQKNTPLQEGFVQKCLWIREAWGIFTMSTSIFARFSGSGSGLGNNSQNIKGD